MGREKNIHSAQQGELRSILNWNWNEHGWKRQESRNKPWLGDRCLIQHMQIVSLEAILRIFSYDCCQWGEVATWMQLGEIESRRSSEGQTLTEENIQRCCWLPRDIYCVLASLSACTTSTPQLTLPYWIMSNKAPWSTHNIDSNETYQA